MRMEEGFKCPFLLRMRMWLDLYMLWKIFIGEKEEEHGEGTWPEKTTDCGWPLDGIVLGDTLC